MDYTQNILSVFHRATPVEVHEGMHWYDTARYAARDLTPSDERIGAGIIAALSPMTQWDENLKKARILVRTGTVYGLTDSRTKAQRILAGANPLDVLPKGKKTYAFYSNIMDINTVDSVTIDRHAYDVAMGSVHVDNNRRIGVKVYRAMAQAYLDVAAIHDMTGAQMQAITWVAWRRMKAMREVA